MAGGGTRGGAGYRHKLTYSSLVQYDDLLTDALVDHLFYWTEIRKSQPVYHPNRLIKTEEIVPIIRNNVINHKNFHVAERKLLESPGFVPFYRQLETPRQREDFRAHLERYLDIYQTDCPFEVTSTNRFTIEKQEASVTARKDIRAGKKIKYLLGVQVNITQEEDDELKRRKRDFSVVISGRNGKRSIFLGPARFCNHDCEPNADLRPYGNDGMEVMALKDIPAGEEITVRYAENYFEDDNSKCLCETCELKLENGWAQYDENGERILPAPLEEVEELDANGNSRRVLRERRMARDYKERPPTPSPPPGKRRGRRPKAQSSPPQIASLSEEYVQDEISDAALSQPPLPKESTPPPPTPSPPPEKRRGRRPKAQSSTPQMASLSEEYVQDEMSHAALSQPPLPKEPTTPPPPKPKRRVPRKQPLRPRNPLYRGMVSIFPEVRTTWVVDDGSTDASSSEDEPEEAESVFDVNVDESILEQDGPCMVVGHGEVRSRLNSKSTPGTSVDAEERLDDILSSPTTPRQHPSRTAVSSWGTLNPLRSRRTTSELPIFENGNIPMAVMTAPASKAANANKRMPKQISSHNQSSQIKVDQSESEGALAKILGPSAETPMDLDSDDAPIPRKSHSTKTATEDEDVDAVLLGVSNNATNPTSMAIKQCPTKRRPGRPAKAPQELPAQNFYPGREPPRPIAAIAATPENSPPKPQFNIPSAHKRRLRGEPTPEKNTPGALGPNTMLAPGTTLNTLSEADEGDEADSEFDGPKNPSRQKRKYTKRTFTKEEEDETPRKRIPGDYLLTSLLLPMMGSAWVNCTLCMEFFVQQDAHTKQLYCPRCVRHSKLYGFCWPKTEPHNGEERCNDWKTIVMEAKWEGIDGENKRMGKRRLGIERAARKKEEMERAKAIAEGRLEVVTEDEEDKAGTGAEEEKADEMDVEPPIAKQNAAHHDGSLTRLAETNDSARQLATNLFGDVSTGSIGKPESKFEVTDAASPIGSDVDMEGEEIPEPPANTNDTAAKAVSERIASAPTTAALSASNAGRLVRRCRWESKRYYPCTCGLQQKVEEEAVSERCNLTAMGADSLLNLLHKNWARDKAVQLMRGVGVKKARKLISRIFQQECDKDEYIECFNDPELAQPTRSSPRSLDEKIASCLFTPHRPCTCGLHVRITLEAHDSRCDLTQFGVDHLMRGLHDPLNKPHAVALLIRTEVNEAREIIASILRFTLNEEMFNRCYDGPHLPYTIVFDEPDEPNTTSTISTPRDQSPLPGTRQPDNSEIDERFETSSTSSLEFVSSKRIDGTPANPQTIPSPLQRPFRYGSSSSDEELDHANTSTTFASLNKAPVGVGAPNKRKLECGMGTPEKRQRSTKDYVQPQSQHTTSNYTVKGKGTQEEPIPLDDTPPDSQTPTEGPSMPEANMIGLSLRAMGLGGTNERPTIMRQDGTPRSAREVYGVNNNNKKRKENEQRQQDEDSDAILFDEPETPPDIIASNTSNDTPKRSRRSNKNRGRGGQFAV